MSKQTSITVQIKKWEAYKGRKDVEHNSWFRCSNRLLEDPDFFEFSAEEILAWIYILSLSSQKNVDTVEIKFAHAERVCRIKKSVMQSALEKLADAQIKIIDTTGALRPRNVDVTSTSGAQKAPIAENVGTCATDRHNRQDITDITNKTGQVAQPEPTALVNLWNETAEKIPEFSKVDLKYFKPKVERYKSAQARLIENPDLEYWRGVIERVAASAFCRGQSDRGWVADFDFLVRPESHVKVMEGKYAARYKPNSKAPPSGALQRNSSAQEEFDSIIGEVMGNAI